MAQGDLVVFEEAKAYMVDGGWEPADSIKVMITSDTPTAADPVPGRNAGATTTYTEVAAGGTYSSGGEVLDTLDSCVTEAAGTMTFDDTGATVTWAQNGANPQDGKYAVVYNSSDTGLERGICFIDLNNTAVVDMQAGDLTITWNGSGMFTIA